MSEPTVFCPNCKTEIRLTESLAAPLVEATRQEFERRLALKDADIATRESSLQAKAVALSQERDSLDQRVSEKMEHERLRIAGEESRKARQLVATDLDQKARELAELQEVLKQREAKLGEAQDAQAETMRKQRELDDARRELELTVEQRVQDGLAAVRDQARREVEDQLKLKVSEKEHIIESMQEQIEELKRRGEQGSQQLQGEVSELELEQLLRARFPGDTIEPVPKGEYGGDVIQRVMGPLGQMCGSILWESKRTKNWSDGWLTKLRGDQQAAKAEVAIIISQALPKDVEAFDFVDNVWVVHPRVAIAVAMTLRMSLVEVTMACQTSEGQQTKMEMVYSYLTGAPFRLRVQAIVEAFSSLQEDLDKERKVITKQWAKREEQINRVMLATAGMYGDLQGIAGKTIQEIDGLEFKAIGASSEETSLD